MFKDTADKQVNNDWECPRCHGDPGHTVAERPACLMQPDRKKGEPLWQKPTEKPAKK